MYVYTVQYQNNLARPLQYIMIPWFWSGRAKLFQLDQTTVVILLYTGSSASFGLVRRRPSHKESRPLFFLELYWFQDNSKFFQYDASRTSWCGASTTIRRPRYGRRWGDGEWFSVPYQSCCCMSCTRSYVITHATPWRQKTRLRSNTKLSKPCRNMELLQTIFKSFKTPAITRWNRYVFVLAIPSNRRLPSAQQPRPQKFCVSTYVSSFIVSIFASIRFDSIDCPCHGPETLRCQRDFRSQSNQAQRNCQGYGVHGI